MDNNRNNEEKERTQPADVLNKEQDPKSIQDPLKKEIEKTSAAQEAEDEQQRKEAMSERD
jgi:hypothetical protein